MENSHPAIVEPAVFDMVQRQMAIRHPGRNRQSCAGIFSSKIKCGDCGSWYGSKVWHSTDKYRRVVWQCNHKFDGGKRCGTPHLDEKTIQELFIKAANAIFEERAGIAEDFEEIQRQQYDTRQLEEERLRLQDELNVVAEMMQQCINENARVALDQTEYQARYDGLTERFDQTKARLDEVSHAITERQAQREKIQMFLADLGRQDGPLTAFDEDAWYSLADYVTVYSKDDIRFTFKNGMEIRV